MLRAGPEAYKGLILEGALIPVAVLIFACRPKKGRRRAARVAWNPQAGWQFKETASPEIIS